MYVTADTWNGDPAGLRDVLTPINLEIRNESTHPLSLRYRNFQISNPNGVQSNALPPFRIRGSVTESAPITPSFAYSNFYVYPYYGFYGPRIGYWGDGWGWDPLWYGTHYGYWQVNLPTADMLGKAIPEGVINPGGNVKGYLYFQKVPQDAESLVFRGTLIDATTHQRFATMTVPFEREKG
jgi:hypothetical protein